MVVVVVSSFGGSDVGAEVDVFVLGGAGSFDCVRESANVVVVGVSVGVREVGVWVPGRGLEDWDFSSSVALF